MAGAEDDFGDLLGLEEGEELVIKKDGEEIKAVEEKKEEPKAAPQQVKAESKPGPGKGKKKKGGKPVDIGGAPDEDEATEMTEEERRKLEEKLKKEEALRAASLMSIDIKTPIADVVLEDRHDYTAFAQVIGLKVGTSALRSNMVAFTLQLLSSLSDELTSEDFDTIGQKAKTLFNNKLKEEKGKDANKKKSKAPKINADRGGPRMLSNPGYDMYEVEGMEGTEQYGGYDEVDFM